MSKTVTTIRSKKLSRTMPYNIILLKHGYIKVLTASFFLFAVTLVLKTSPKSRSNLLSVDSKKMNIGYETNVNSNNNRHDRRDSEVWIDDKMVCDFLNPYNEDDDNDSSKNKKPPPPLPIVLISLGRSGSSVTWDTLSRLMSGASSKDGNDKSKKLIHIQEFTGGNPNASDIFFDSIPHNVGQMWASEKLCKIQNTQYNLRTTRKNGKKNNSTSINHPPIVGFQWKPYKKSWDHIYAKSALEEMGYRQHPKIRAIHLQRNPIDRMISNLKHKDHTHTGHHHCLVGDVQCLKDHEAFTSKKSKNGGITIPINDLLTRIRQDKHNNIITQGLSESGLKHITVSYEKLFNKGDGKNQATEWMRIFQFLNVEPMIELTMNNVRDQFSMASTSRPKKDTVANWDEVVKALEGTEYVDLLK